MSNKRVTTIEWSQIDQETREIIRQYRKPPVRWSAGESLYLTCLVRKKLQWKEIANLLNATYHNTRSPMACRVHNRSANNV